MRKLTTHLLALGVAAASLTSCSRANYAFQPAPAYLGVQAVHAAVPMAMAVPVANETIAASTFVPKAVVSIAPAAAKAPVNKPVSAVMAAAANTTIAAKPETSRAERKAVRQQVKSVIASHKSTSAEGKSQLVAALLCFFLGGLGIHDFYLGYIGKGILQIVLSLLIVGFILVIIDFVRILIGSLKPKDGDYSTKL